MKMTEMKRVSTRDFYSSIFVVIIIFGVIAVALLSGGENNVHARTCATVIFSDGFESGNFNAWDGFEGAYGVLPTVVYGVAHSGSYSAFANYSENHCCWEGKDNSAPSWGATVCARAYFKFGNSSSDFCPVILLSNWGSGRLGEIAYAGLGHQTGDDYVWFTYYLNGPSTNANVTNSPFALNESAWYCVELDVFVDSSEGFAKLFINGNLVLSGMHLNDSLYGAINHVDFGIFDGGCVWWDDCVIANSYIGLEPSTPDLAVTNVMPSKTALYQGFSTSINVTAANLGPYTETFNVTTYANATSIATQSVTLASGSMITITFTWNTTGFAYGNYTISAYAWPVPGETNLANNNCTGGTVRVNIPGDANGDGVVDAQDFYILERAWGTSIGQPGYDPRADFNGDGVVDAQDFYILEVHWGMSIVL